MKKKKENSDKKQENQKLFKAFPPNNVTLQIIFLM